MRLLGQANGLTREQLTQRAGLPPERLAQLLCGGQNFTSNEAEAIARAIGGKKALAFATYFENFRSFGIGAMN